MQKMFAVSTRARTNVKITDKYCLFDKIKKRMGTPLFLARTISSNERMYDSEVEFLREKQCNILLIYNGLKKDRIKGKYGYADALGAAISAQELGAIPFNRIVIFAEIEPKWTVNLRWMNSYIEELLKFGYIPGFICSEEMYRSIDTLYIEDELSRWVRPATNDPRVSFMLFDCKKDKRNTKKLKNNIDLKLCDKRKVKGIDIDIIEITDASILKNLWDGEQIFYR